jgi:hypothetical protein
MAAEALTRLAALVGRWRTEGWTRETAGAPAVKIEALDTYDWLPGGYALLHKVDAHVGPERVVGAEIVGWDPDRAAYVTLYVGSDGLSSYEAQLTEESGTLVWTMQSRSDRFRGIFSEDGDTIDGHWEQLTGDGSWRPWMDITLRRSG